MDVAEGVGRDTDRRFARGLAGLGLRRSPSAAALSRLRRTVKVSGELGGYGGFPGLAPVVMARREAGRLSEGRTAGSVH